jgi:hypothetical protein
VDTGATAGVSVERSKLAGESGSRASMLIVRQFTAAIVACLHYISARSSSKRKRSVAISKERG